MSWYPILEACARCEGHEAQYQALREHCLGFDDWQGLLQRAEQENMAPLLQKHLVDSGVNIPPAIRRSLHILYRRHQHQAQVRLRLLEEALVRWQQQGLTPILLKGAALCLSLYKDPALRPMRDMDVLFSRDQVNKAHQVLQEAGFGQSVEPVSPGHHHLPPLHKKVDEVSVCFELHLGLYPDCPPWYPEVDFARLLATGRTVSIGTMEAVVFNHEEMLHYLYQHGFRAPLPFETFKLINAADIIGYTEKYHRQIDWQQLRERFPGLFRALPLMHHIAPWDCRHRAMPFLSISSCDSRHKLLSAPFRGWPQRRTKELQGHVSLGSVLKETLLPSNWWLRVYYGAGYSSWRLAKAMIVDHPRNVFWWINVYSHFVIETDTKAVNPDNSVSGSFKLFFVSLANKFRGVLQKLSALKNGCGYRERS